MRRTIMGLGVSAFALALVLGAPGPARATLDIQKKAKAGGFPATNCQYCHVEKLPKKGASTNNDRGKWLVDKKAKDAKEVDVTCLKEYVEKK